jgi:hypothetical protein
MPPESIRTLTPEATHGQAEVRHPTDGWIKVVEIKKKDSSTRSSVRKSGKQAEMLDAEKVGVK